MFNISRSRTSLLLAFVLLAAIALPGVSHAADQQKYSWSSYQTDFLNLALNPGPAAEAKFEATLLKIISKSEKDGTKPPPGLTAEYGYLLFKRGEFDSAIDHFEREGRAWPESVTLMKRMIEQAEDKMAEASQNGAGS